MMEIDEPEPDGLPLIEAGSDRQYEEEYEAAKARLVNDDDVEAHLSEVLGSYQRLETLASNLGAVVGIWSRIDQLEEEHGMYLAAHYFYDSEAEEYFFAYPLEPAQIGYKWLKPGAKMLLREVQLFSPDWYLCHAFLHLQKCFESSGMEQLRQSFLFGKSLAEGSWKERAEEGFDAANREKLRSRKAGAGGAKFQTERKSANLEALMAEIEVLSHLSGAISDDRLLSQAFDNVTEARSDFPKSQKTRESYATELSSEDPFKTRYWAVFGKKA